MCNYIVIGNEMICDDTLFMALSNENIDLPSLSSLKSLIYTERGIEYLSSRAFKRLSNITHLDLYNNDITDISALAGLTELETLCLRCNKITDVSALKGLTKLTKLDLSNNQISDISALAELTNLTDLDLSVTKITDISALAGLTKLKRLNLCINKLSDVSALAGLTKLEVLELWRTLVTNDDIVCLKQIPSLRFLNFYRTNVSDASAIYYNHNKIEKIILGDGSIINIRG